MSVILISKALGNSTC